VNPVSTENIANLGVGPLVAAGAIASAAIPAAAATGGAVGGLEKVMTDHGVSRVDASYYKGRFNEGACSSPLIPALRASPLRKQLTCYIARAGTPRRVRRWRWLNRLA